MNGPFLIQLDEANFANIPSKVVPRTIRLKDPSFETLEARECIFIGYCEKLLYKNDRLMAMLKPFVNETELSVVNGLHLFELEQIAELIQNGSTITVGELVASTDS